MVLSQLSFTGGEPTIHRQFSEIVEPALRGRYTFSFVSNGLNFPQIYPMVLGLTMVDRRYF